MGEIRSTLDIIMEKAKSLEVSEEEKAEIRKKEVEAKGRGMVQKFLDGALSLEDITGEIGDMDEQAQKWIKQSMLNDCKERLNFERANGKVLELLDKVLGISVGPIKDLMEKFEKDLLKQAGEVREKMTEDLRNRGIGGSAVIVNHKASEKWRHLETRLHHEFKKQLEQLC